MKTLKIPAMACEHCAKRIEETLQTFVEEWTLDLATKTVKLKISDVDMVTLTKALADNGYEVSEIIDE